MRVMTLPFAALVFDMDGTLTDSESWWDEVRRGLAAEDGVAWPPTATTDMPARRRVSTAGLASGSWRRS